METLNSWLIEGDLFSRHLSKHQAEMIENLRPNDTSREWMFDKNVCSCFPSPFATHSTLCSHYADIFVSRQKSEKNLRKRNWKALTLDWSYF